MSLVIGFGPVIEAKSDWKTYFTTYYTGKINVLRAPKAILTDLLGLTPAQADAWITLRNGKDGIEGTDDDLQPGTIQDAATLMGANKAQRALLEDTCAITGNTRRIESTGYCNGINHRITVVLGGSSTAGSSLLGWWEQ